MCVVEERIGSLITFHVHNAESLSSLDFMSPRIARRNDVAIDGIGGQKAAGGEGGSGHGAGGRRKKLGIGS